MISLFLLLIFVICSASVLWAQGNQWAPQTANMALEQATVNPLPVLETEATTTYDAYPSEPRPVQGRRNAESNDPFGGSTIDDVTNPKDLGVPVGDVPVAFLLLLAGLYAASRRRMSY